MAIDEFQRPNGAFVPKQRSSFWEILDETKIIAGLLGLLVVGGYLAIPATRWQLDELKRETDAHFSISEEKLNGKFAVVGGHLEKIMEEHAALRDDMKELLRRIPETKTSAPAAPNPAPSQAVHYRPKHKPKATGILGF